MDRRRLRRRLDAYEDRYNKPFKVLIPGAIGSCPRCDGSLSSARMDDDHGPKLEIASGQAVYADGSPVFESAALAPDEVMRLEWTRGMLRGAWCPACRDYFP